VGRTTPGPTRPRPPPEDHRHPPGQDIKGVFRLRGDRGRAGRSERTWTRTPERTAAGSGHRTTEAGHEEGPRAFTAQGPSTASTRTPPAYFWYPPGRGRTGSPLKRPVLLARVMVDRNRPPPFRVELTAPVSLSVPG